MINKRIENVRANNEAKYKLGEVKTVEEAGGVKHYDSDGDGIADYLQRAELKSVIKSISDSNLAEIDTQRDVERWEMKLRGYKFDPDTNVYRPEEPPIMNETGILELGGLLESAMNKHAMTTSFDKEWLHQDILSNCRDACKLLLNSKKRFGISQRNCDVIIKQIENLLFYTLSKSVDDKGRGHKTQRERVTKSEQMQPSGSISI